MASTVFGAPVTSESLKGSRFQRAREALMSQNTDGKEDKAKQSVNAKKEKYGPGASTKCIIYNATGDKITYVLNHDYHGYIYDLSPYPLEIENGQWGAFLHVHAQGAADGSSAAVVYRGLNDSDDRRAWCLAWMTPGSSNSPKLCAYAEVRENYGQDRWADIYQLMEKAGPSHDYTWGGCVSEGKIGSAANDDYYIGIMTLEGAEVN